MVAKQERFGRKNRKGFYDYPESGPKSLWPDMKKIAGKSLDPDTIRVKDLKDRFLFPPALEAARCMFEGVVTDPRRGRHRLGLRLRLPPFTGGTLSFIDGMGLKAFVARARGLQPSTAPASPRLNDWSRWPRKARHSTGLSAAPERPPESVPRLQ